MLTRCSSTVRSEVIESPFCHGEDAEEEEEAEVPILMERKVDFPEVKESTWCFFFLFWIVRGRGFIAHWSICRDFSTIAFRLSSAKIEISHLHPQYLKSWISCHAGEFLLHLGEGNGRGGLSSLGDVAGHESEDYNWWPHSLQRWRLF